MTSTFKPKWPDDFHGEESKWYEWSFQTRAYVAASKIFEAKYLREAEKNSDPITFDALDSVSRTNASSQGKDPDLEAADAHGMLSSGYVWIAVEGAIFRAIAARDEAMRRRLSHVLSFELNAPDTSNPTASFSNCVNGSQTVRSSHWVSVVAVAAAV